MKITTFADKDAWMEGRKGKITGSRVGDVVMKKAADGYKMGFYELLAERLAIVPDGENPMDRGTRLETEAIERFMKETGKKVDTSLVIWERDDNPNIAISPDGFMKKKEATEVKCLNSALHIKTYLTKKIPKEYEDQGIQYFVVNDDLETLYFLFYDPRFPGPLAFFVLEMKREDVQESVVAYLEYERKVLDEVNRIVTELTF